MLRRVFPFLVLLATLRASAAVYVNPLPMTGPGGMTVQSCADPTVIRGQTPNDTDWYMYCTRDPLGDADKDASGNWVYRNIPTFASHDLVHWSYVNDAIPVLPSWASPLSSLWAPETVYFDGSYHLYFAVTDTRASGGGSNTCTGDDAIGVATSASPTGPWTVAGAPVVAPRQAGTGCDYYATIDPDVITDGGGQRWIYYGSYYGGIQVRELSADGLSSNPLTAVQVAIPNRYEGAEVVAHGGFYYLFGSATDCCRGPLTGYSVFVGRASSPTGPFSDREGNLLTAGRAGGDPALSFNGNGFVGPGHNTVFDDLQGQTWTIYHAVVEADPYFAGSVGYTKRPAMMDAVDWVDGWPVVRGGWWVSSCPEPAPAAQPGDPEGYVPALRGDDAPGAPVPSASDEFDGSALGPQWSWVRPPPPADWGVEGGVLRMDTEAGDLYVDDNSAPVLLEPAPPGDYLVEAKLDLDLPAEGCCQNYVQAGLVIYGDDDNYVKLVHASIWETRQTEWAKELAPVPAGYPRYGNSVVGAPSGTTWLRIARRARAAGGASYTAYTSQDGVVWQRGATWNHDLGTNERIGLVAMAGTGYVARFDYVRTSTLVPAPDNPFEGPPGEITGVALSGGAATTIAWSAAPKAGVYDVDRGLLSELPSGTYGGCLADDLADTSTGDAEVPAPQTGFFYLVRGENPGCGGAGPWGSRSDGTPRIPTGPTACP